MRERRVCDMLLAQLRNGLQGLVNAVCGSVHTNPEFI
jgi:hypothetical protein